MVDQQCILRAENLTVGYGTKRIISDINVYAKKGQMVCLLGPNGAGKTTILRTISGHLNPIEGKIFLFEKEIPTIKKKELAKKLSVVLTERINPDLITVEQMVSLGRHPHTNFWGSFSKEDKQIVASSLKLVHADHLTHRYYSNLSDGEKQKVMIARALAQEPEVMVLDEPTSHLDVKHKVDVLSILRKMSRDKGITTIISLHDVDLALKTCDIIVLVKDGEIINWGSPEEIVGSETISELYDIELAGYNHTLGCLELLCPQNPKVFILAGGGTGISVYRTLLKHNIGFYTGVLHKNDIDTYISSTMKANPIIENENGEMENTLLHAKKVMDECDVVIDTGYKGKEYPYNDKLLEYANGKDKQIISVQEKENDDINMERYLMPLLIRMRAERKTMSCASMNDGFCMNKTTLESDIGNLSKEGQYIGDTYFNHRG